MNHKLTTRRSKRGSLLIESIVAISITLVGMLGVLGLLSRSIGINKDISQKFIATYLAAEGIEVVKSLIDKSVARGESFNSVVSAGVNYRVNYNSNSLLPNSNNPLLFDPSTGIYSYNNGESTPFRRTITITEFDRNDLTGNDEIKVLSRVEWSVRGKSQVVELEDHFFDWR